MLTDRPTSERMGSGMDGHTDVLLDLSRDIQAFSQPASKSTIISTQTLYSSSCKWTRLICRHSPGRIGYVLGPIWSGSFTALALHFGRCDFFWDWIALSVFGGKWKIKIHDKLIAIKSWLRQIKICKQKTIIGKYECILN